MESVKVKVGQVWGIAKFHDHFQPFEGYRVEKVTEVNANWVRLVEVRHVKKGTVHTLWTRPEWFPGPDLKLIEDVP